MKQIIARLSAFTLILALLISCSGEKPGSVSDAKNPEKSKATNTSKGTSISNDHSAKQLSKAELVSNDEHKKDKMELT